MKFFTSAIAGLLTVSFAATANGFSVHKNRDYAADPTGYVFVYFSSDDEGGEQIFLAASNGNNALSWTELNDGKPILSSTEGTRGLRDPFMMRSYEGDRFFLLATDLKVGDIGWPDAHRFGSLYLEIWESKDLINWSEQRHTLVSLPTAGMTWAPEAYYDEEIRKYVVYWASRIYSEDDPNHEIETYTKMLYITTSDFITFSEPVIWQDSNDRIDSTVIKDGELYYRFTKDFGTLHSAPDGSCVDIIQESSPHLRASDEEWTFITDCIGGNAGLGPVEGPTIFKANRHDVNGEKLYLFVDEFVGQGYVPLETENLANPAWKVSENSNLPRSPRHGSVVPVTQEELDAVLAYYG